MQLSREEESSSFERLNEKGKGGGGVEPRERGESTGTKTEKESRGESPCKQTVALNKAYTASMEKTRTGKSCVGDVKYEGDEMDRRL